MHSSAKQIFSVLFVHKRYKTRKPRILMLLADSFLRIVCVCVCLYIFNIILMGLVIYDGYDIHLLIFIMKYIVYVHDISPGLIFVMRLPYYDSSSNIHTNKNCTFLN